MTYSTPSELAEADRVYKSRMNPKNEFRPKNYFNILPIINVDTRILENAEDDNKESRALDERTLRQPDITTRL